MALTPKREAPPETKFLGDIPLHVLNIYVDSNDKQTLVGINLRSGEKIEIRLAGETEFAELYVNYDTFPSVPERRDQAKIKIKTRLGLKTLNGKLAGGLVGQVVQMKGVHKYPQGKNVARWIKPITRDRKTDLAMRGDVEYVTVQSGADEPVRKLNTLHPRDACPVTLDSLAENLSNKVRGWDGHANEANVISRPMVSMVDKNDTIESCFLPASFDAETNEQRSGIDAFKNINMSPDNHRVLACVAGRVDISLAALKGYEGLNEHQQDTAASIHAMSANGEIEIAITHGASMNLLQSQLDKVLASETGQTNSVSLTGRGFFEADFSVRSDPNDDGVILPPNVFVRRKTLSVPDIRFDCDPPSSSP